MSQLQSLFILLILFTLPNSLLAQSQACAEAPPWPSSINVSTADVFGVLVTTFEMQPAINAEVLYTDVRIVGRELVFDFAIIDNCSGFGLQPPLVVQAQIQNITPGRYSAKINVDEVSFGYINVLPTVTVDSLIVGLPVSVPVLTEIKSQLILIALVIIVVLIWQQSSKS